MSRWIDVVPVVCEVYSTSSTVMRGLAAVVANDADPDYRALLEPCFLHAPYCTYEECPFLWRAAILDDNDKSSMVARWVKNNQSTRLNAMTQTMNYFKSEEGKRDCAWSKLGRWMRKSELEWDLLNSSDARIFAGDAGKIRNGEDFRSFEECFSNLSARHDDDKAESATGALQILKNAGVENNSAFFKTEELVGNLAIAIAKVCNRSGPAYDWGDFFEDLLPRAGVSVNLYRDAWLGRALYADAANCQPAIDAYRSIFPPKEELPFIEAWRDSLLSASSSSQPDSASYTYLGTWMANCVERINPDLAEDLRAIFFFSLLIKDKKLTPTHKRAEPAWIYFYVLWTPINVRIVPFTFDDVSRWMTWVARDLKGRAILKSLQGLESQISNSGAIFGEHEFSEAMIAVFTYGFGQGDGRYRKPFEGLLDWIFVRFQFTRMQGDDRHFAKLVWETLKKDELVGYSLSLNFSIKNSDAKIIDPKDQSNLDFAQASLGGLKVTLENVETIYNTLEHFGPGIARQGLLQEVEAALVKEKSGPLYQYNQYRINIMEQLVALLLLKKN